MKRFKDNILTFQEMKSILYNKYKSNANLIIFCFGHSLISRVIQAKTKENDNEQVPSHVALLIGNSIYESTSLEDEIRGKTIPAGVRRYMLEDYLALENGRGTDYALAEIDNFNMRDAELHVHKPYGKDSIVQFLVLDASKGSHKGLICSEYANKVIKASKKKCPSPADLYRIYKYDCIAKES